MGVPYSQDLRQRVLAALDGGMSKMVVHRTFRVSRSTIDDWVKLREQTGSVVAKTRSGRRGAAKLPDLLAVREFAVRHKDKTVEQMALLWQQETGQKVSDVTLGKAMRRLGWTRKKSLGAMWSEMKSSDASSSNS